MMTTASQSGPWEPQNKLNSNIEMFTNNGFCPDCEFQPTTDRVLVGALNLAYSNSRLIDFDVNLVDPLNSINWQLNDVVLSPLSSELFDPALQ